MNDIHDSINDSIQGLLSIRDDLKEQLRATPVFGKQRASLNLILDHVDNVIEELVFALPCEHDDVDMDERCCLDCGKDMTEDIASAYEYRYEGDR